MRLDLINKILPVGRRILCSFGDELGAPPYATKQRICLLFLARSVRQLDAIGSLSTAKFVSDAWILYRCLVERYLLFRHLSDTDAFQVFDDYCFRTQYESNNRIKSSDDLKHKKEVRSRRITPTEAARYRAIQADKKVQEWRRPDIEETAKKHNLKFLYDAGYDHACGFVHPISTDGTADFFRLLDRPTKAPVDGADVLVNNAILVTLLHMQEFLNQPEYRWVKLIYDALDRFLQMLEDPSIDCDDVLIRLSRLERSTAAFLTKAAA